MSAAELATTAIATGSDAARVADELAQRIGRADLVLALVFADWRLDPAVMSRELQRALPGAAVVGCTTIGVIGRVHAGDAPAAVALGLHGDWLRVGVGIAAELTKSPLARAKDAVDRAAAQLGTTAAALDPARHAALTLVDGTCGHEEAFCIATAAAAPRVRFVGGSAATEVNSGRKTYVWARGEALADAGVVVLLDSARPFEAVTSSHLVATDIKTVVTAADGRTIHELDGQPAAARMRELVAQLGSGLDEERPSELSFARIIDGVPYVRSMTHIEGSRIHLAAAVESGHVLRLMRPGDLIGQTRGDLARVATRVGGEVAAFVAFSCIGRHWEAAARGLERELAGVYAEYPTVGFQSYGEQTGVLLVNHTLTGLAIGAPMGRR